MLQVAHLAGQPTERVVPIKTNVFIMLWKTTSRLAQKIVSAARKKYSFAVPPETRHSHSNETIRLLRETNIVFQEEYKDSL